jgi:hypothetical protein
MPKNIIIVLIYHLHRPLDHTLKRIVYTVTNLKGLLREVAHGHVASKEKMDNRF